MMSSVAPLLPLPAPLQPLLCFPFPELWFQPLRSPPLSPVARLLLLGKASQEVMLVLCALVWAAEGTGAGPCGAGVAAEAALPLLVTRWPSWPVSVCVALKAPLRGPPQPLPPALHTLPPPEDLRGSQ